MTKYNIKKYVKSENHVTNHNVLYCHSSVELFLFFFEEKIPSSKILEISSKSRLTCSCDFMEIADIFSNFGDLTFI